MVILYTYITTEVRCFSYIVLCQHTHTYHHGDIKYNKLAKINFLASLVTELLTDYTYYILS